MKKLFAMMSNFLNYTPDPTTVLHDQYRRAQSELLVAHQDLEHAHAVTGLLTRRCARLEALINPPKQQAAPHTDVAMRSRIAGNGL